MPIHDNLNPEYENVVTKILNDVRYGFNSKDRDQSALARIVAIYCQALADKPVKRLSDEQIRGLIWKFNSSAMTQYDLALSIEDAHIKLNSEPEEVPFDYALWKTCKYQAYYQGEPVDEIKPHLGYTMRLKS